MARPSHPSPRSDSRTIAPEVTEYLWLNADCNVHPPILGAPERADHDLRSVGNNGRQLSIKTLFGPDDLPGLAAPAGA